MRRNLYIGTSGWSYKHWKELYYPSRLPSTRWLKHYSEEFGTTEINGSFYKLPSVETVMTWVGQVPDDFIFCPKMSRYLTHMKKLMDPEEPLERFFSVFGHMRHMMGPVLVQLPPVLGFDYERAEALYRLMRKSYRSYQFVIEVRHNSWLDDDSLNLMAKYEIGLVISQSADHFPYSEMVTAKNVYIRFHGPGELYASAYSEELLSGYAKKIGNWIKDGHVVWAYFNNDMNGYAVEDARRLKLILKEFI
ncbi:MAG TPA: DUF72 domain-containing protein [Flavisolibacter sp.]|nr:DUF72 domain-containing protein [Flavisolibacter sp.]